MQKSKAIPRVFFNASVLLAGLKNPHGGSGKLITWVRRRAVAGIVSEVVLDEVLRHTVRTGLTRAQVQIRLASSAFMTMAAPTEKEVMAYHSKVIDPGDAHILAASISSRANYLVSLDKKHILVLAGHIKGLIILTPGEFIRAWKNTPV